MQAEIFAEALLNAKTPVPASIKGQPQKRFAVYRNNVIVGLVNALRSNFPAVQILLGTPYFSGLATEFVRAHPPTSQLMFEYGLQFPEFLARQNDLADYPYLRDVAQLEIMMRRAYHAADVEALNPEHLAKVDPNALGALQFAAHPSLALMQSRYAVGSIVRSNLSEEHAALTFDVAENIIISRVENSVRVLTVELATFEFISSLIEGTALAKAADVAFEIDDNFDLGAALAFILEYSIFRNLEPQS